MDDLKRKESNHTYEVTLVLSNLQSHQLDVLTHLIDELEENGVGCNTFDIQND